MQIAFEGPTSGLEIVRELLSPWDISFTDSSRAETTITYDTLPEVEKFVVIPSNSTDFVKKAKKTRLDFEVRLGGQVSVDACHKTRLTMTPTCSFRYGQWMNQEGTDNGIIEANDASKVYLTIDIIDEFKHTLDGILNPKISRTYKILTNMPIPYSIAPRQVKNLLMRKRHEELSHQSFCAHLSLDTTRFILAAAIEKSSGKKLLRKNWDKKQFAFVMTHDVDSQEGFGRSKRLKNIEEKYDIPSAWYIPSKRYRLDPESVKSLASYGEIGCHDTKHDGKLVFLARKKLNLRISEAKTALERLTGRSIDGFRSPLLQYNANIMAAVEKAGFCYDSSIPTWEPKHPLTMKSHGIQTMFPLSLGGLIEIPITLPQDHQMLSVSGLTCREALEKWSSMVNVIKNLGGLCSFLVHPDYELSDLSNGVYEELLNLIASEKQALITLPSGICNAKKNEILFKS